MGQIQDAFTIAGGIVEAAIAGATAQASPSAAPVAPDAPIGSTVGQAPGDTQAPGTVTLPAIATLTVKGIDVRVESQGPLLQGYNLVISQALGPDGSAPTYPCALTIVAGGTAGIGQLTSGTGPVSALPAGSYQAWLTNPVTYEVSPPYSFTV